MMWNLCLGLSILLLAFFIFLAILNHVYVNITNKNRLIRNSGDREWSNHEYVNIRNKKRLIKNNGDLEDSKEDRTNSGPILQRRPTLMATWLIAGVFVSAFLLVLPLCRMWALDVEPVGNWFVSVFHAIRSSFQIFSLDVDYFDFYSDVGMAVYRGFAAILYVLAPIFLISFVMTIFRNLFANIRIAFTNRRPIYAFSELNERSLTLAESCLIHYWNEKNEGVEVGDKENRNSGEKKSPIDYYDDEEADFKREKWWYYENEKESRNKPLILFTDVYEQQEEASAELVSNARSIGALCIRSDILSLTMGRFRFQKKRVKFFILGSGEAENIGHAVGLIENYSDDKNISLYVFTESEESKLLIGSALDESIKMGVRFINTAQALVYNYLYNIYDKEKNPKKLLQILQKKEQEGKEKQEKTPLSIVLVGLGQHGTELLRALIWYAQLPHVYPRIHVFERDLSAEQKFASQCPELIGMNHKRVEGESRYDIIFHHTEDGRGFDAETIDFDRKILNLREVDVAFVALGKDAENIRIAVKLRRLFGQSHPEADTAGHPMIRAIVYDPDKTKIAEEHGIHDLKADRERYGIGLMGDIKTEWSYDVILADNLEYRALQVHMEWDKIQKKNTGKTLTDKEKKRENKFYIFDYNRKSSMSTVIRSKIRCWILLTEQEMKGEEPISEEKREELRKTEHIGWNAYLRGEGYQYGPDRDDLLKFHPLLLPHGALPESERAKDDGFVNPPESEEQKPACDGAATREDEDKDDAWKKGKGLTTEQIKYIENMGLNDSQMDQVRRGFRKEIYKDENKMEEYKIQRPLSFEEVMLYADPGYDQYHMMEIIEGLREGADAKKIKDYLDGHSEYRWTDEIRERIAAQRKAGDYPTYAEHVYSSGRCVFYKPILAYTEMEKERKSLTR